MYKIAVIGRREGVLCYKTSGFTVITAESSDGAAESLKSLEKDGYAIIFVTEDIAAEITEHTDKYKSKSVPSIVTLPCALTKTDFGMRSLRAACERAVGSDVLK